MPTKQCPQCGCDQSPSARFCNHCGTAFFKNRSYWPAAGVTIVERSFLERHRVGLIAVFLGVVALAGIVQSSRRSSIPQPAPSQTAFLPSLPATTPNSVSTPRITTSNHLSGKIARNPKSTTNVKNQPAPLLPYQSPSTPASTPRGPNGPRQSGLIRGPRGGCYYINSRGNKTYVDRSMCN